ncbi:MAG TPA: DinB family protein [Anaerolineales bacterium]|nr:DinB family protein [Anaerolineales bacterium]
MADPLHDLHNDIRKLADRAITIGEAELEARFVWGSYSSEGVRFGFFRVLEELDMLEAVLNAGSERVSQARAILAGYHEAYRDLEALVWGLDDEAASTSPGGEEWDVRTTYAHILGADFGFFVVTRFALDLHRAGEWSPDHKIKDGDYDRILETDETRYLELMDSPLSILRREHRLFHDRVLAALSDITDVELDLPSKYWEAETHPLRFRLGRFASHMRQHTIQIEKTLPATGRPLNETSLLVRRILNRLAGIENVGRTPDPAAVQPARDALRAVFAAISP